LIKKETRLLDSDFAQLVRKLITDYTQIIHRLWIKYELFFISIYYITKIKFSYQQQFDLSTRKKYLQ